MYFAVACDITFQVSEIVNRLQYYPSKTKFATYKYFEDIYHGKKDAPLTIAFYNNEDSFIKRRSRSSYQTSIK